MELKPVVIDLETSVKNRGSDSIGNNKADPFVMDNKVVLYGARFADINHIFTTGLKLKKEFLYVGQNIKFDLHYLLRDPENADIWPHLTVWDTQLAEYLLTGQQSKMVSLDKLAEKYGGTLKDDRIKEYWDAGIDTEDIPEEELIPYLEGDLENTVLVYEAQKKRAEELGMLTLIESQMEALMATTEMEYNGMHFARDTAMIELGGLLVRKNALEKSLVKQMEYILPSSYIPVPNPESNDHLSVVLFGGPIKYTADAQVLDDDGMPIKYKSGKKAGQIKTRKEQRIFKTNGLCVGVPLEEWSTKKEGMYSSDSNVLKFLVENEQSLPAVAFCEELLEYRTLCKEVGTYYGPYISLLHSDGCIHGRLQHTNTNTGRLSSVSPNLQNITNED